MNDIVSKTINNVDIDYNNTVLQINNFWIDKVTFGNDKLQLVLTNKQKALFLEIDKNTYVDNLAKSGILLSFKDNNKLIECLNNLYNELRGF